MDIDKLVEKHHNVSREEVEKIRKISEYPTFSKFLFEKTVSSLDEKREKEKVNGRGSVAAGPLVQLLSMHFLPRQVDENKPLTIGGRICAKFRHTTSGEIISHQLYSREPDDAQVLGPSRALTLISPDVSCQRLKFCMPWHVTRLIVNVFAGVYSFAGRFSCAEDMTDSEQVRLEYIHGELGSLAIRYIAMPFAVYGHVQVGFSYKKGYSLDGELLPSLDVTGKIVARYGNTYGSNGSEDLTLFEKDSDEFERVEINPINCEGNIALSRCCVGVPAYSSLVVELDLSEFGTERRFLKETVELRVENGYESFEEFIVDDILIDVRVRWYLPKPQGRCIEEEHGIELEYESSDG